MEEWLWIVCKDDNTEMQFFIDITMVSYLSQSSEKAFYFLLLAGVQGLNLTHVPSGRQRELKHLLRGKNK